MKLKKLAYCMSVALVATPLLARADTDYDSLSVLGQFDFKSDAENAAINVGLGKFFSTGMAAKKLSDGFAAKLCGEYLAAKKTENAPQDPPKTK